MNLIYRKAFLFVTLLSASSSYCQPFGGNPSSVKWSQVNTPQVRVIFPAQLDSPAKRIANIISFLNSSTQNTIGTQQKKISLVLQDQTVISNGYVSLAPFRSEFFLTPLQNSFELGSMPWHEMLAIHEFRHVQQYNNFNVGASKVLRTLFGEAGQALANNATIPNWFFEGDAVFSETNISGQGRGRLPFFHNAFRSLWQADKKYSWMKLRNDSYKDFIPTHYALGYLLVAYGTEKYGDEFWKKVTLDAAALKGIFYPFQKAIKKYSGKTYAEFRNDALTYFKNKFNVNNEKEKPAAPGKPFTSEEYPAFADERSVVFVKTSFKKIHSFVIRRGNEEKKIRVKDVSLDNHFSYRNGRIVYASYRHDKRWGNREFNDLQILDVTNGSQRTLSRNAKYFSPDIDEAGTKIVAVKMRPGGQSNLQILNATNGEILSSLPNPQNLFYTYPKFYGDNIIAAVRNNMGMMSLELINTSSGSSELLVPFSANVLGFPSIFNDTLYFSAAHGEEDRLFALSLINKKIFLLQSARMKKGIGNYQPTANSDQIGWTTFTDKGYKLQLEDKKSMQWEEIPGVDFAQKIPDFGISLYDKTNVNSLAGIPSQSLQVKKYSKSTGLINFHSLLPGVDDPEYSLTLVGNNILNSIQTSLGLTYNRAEKWKKIGLGADYAGLFPYLSAGIDYTIDRRGRYRNNTVYWNELEPRAGISLPLNLSKERSLTFMNIGSNYVYNRTDFQGTYKDSLGKFSYSYLSNFFTIHNQVQKAKQDIHPRFAQSLSLSYKTALTDFDGSQFVSNGNLYLPGLFSNHNLVFNGAYLRKDTLGQLNFSSGFPFSRGYQAENLHEMIKWGANYHLPLLYPDAGFANIAYLLRVRANIFYDHTHVNDFFVNGSSFKANFRSAGTELFFETKWWNQAFVTFGIRYSYLLDHDLFGGTGNNRWEFILPVNLFEQ